MICNSEEEAISASKNKKSNEIPVYFFESDTTGEKKIEEFYTEDEIINFNKYSGLGFFEIKKNNLQYDVNKLCEDLYELFNNKLKSKKNILETINKYLPNFNHMEFGKNLDDKM